MPGRPPLWQVFTGLGLAVVCAGAAAIGSALTSRQQSAAASASQVVNQVVTTAFDLDQVTFDLITGGDPDAPIRWSRRVTHLDRLLDQLRHQLDDPELRHRLTWMTADLQRADRLFRRLAEGTGPGDPGMGDERRLLIGGQLQIHTRQAVAQAEAMQRWLVEARRQDDRHGVWFFGIVSGVLAVVLAGTVVLVLRYERRLRAETRALERSNADLERFAFACSHDLREPLRMVSSYLELLAERGGAGLDGRSFGFLVRAREGATRMHALIRSILDLSRLGTGNAPPLVPVELGSVLSDASELLRARLDAARAVIHLGHLPRVSGDAHLLRQVFVNLLTNALVHRGDAPPMITISAEPRDRMWLVRVDDQGPGVPPDQRERVFAPFVRLHPRDRSEGSGLGLAICQRIVELHRGRIWMDAAPGGGARVCLLLPMG